MTARLAVDQGASDCVEAYNKRTSVERVFARLKGHRGLTRHNPPMPSAGNPALPTCRPNRAGVSARPVERGRGEYQTMRVEGRLGNKVGRGRL